MSELDPDAGEAREEALASALARRVRETGRGSEAAPTVWEAVVRGERALDEVVGEESADAERAKAYFRAFDADERQSLVDGLLATIEVDEGEAEVIPLRRADEPTEKAEAKPAEAEPEVVQKPEPKPEPEGSYWIVGGLLLAAAAAILLWWIWPPANGLQDQPEVAQIQPLPSYGTPEIGGGLAVTRSDLPEPTARHRYRRDGEFEWVWRPSVAVEGEVELRAFVFVEGSKAGLTLRLAELTTIAETGAVRIAGTIDRLGLEPGSYTIALVIGRPETLPEQAEELATTSEPPWQVQRFDIAIESSS